MSDLKIMEDKIVSAVKDFAHTVKPGGKIVADMSPLIEATEQLPLSNFDYWECLIRNEYSLAMKSHATSTWKLWSQPPEILTLLDLISWDGYKREKTLRTLSGAIPNTFFYSLVLRRLNDWVPQVRNAARDKLVELTRATNPEYVVEALCIALANWNSWGRIEDIDKSVILNVISEERIAESFKRKLVSSASGPMASIFSQLGRTPVLDEYIEDIAALAIQPSLRAKAYRSLFEGRITWMEGRKWVWTDIRYCEGRLKPVVAERKVVVKTPLLDLLRMSAEDSSSIVRRVSAEIVIRELDLLGRNARDLAEKFVSDKSLAVSERGRFAIKRLDEAGRSPS